MTRRGVALACATLGLTLLAAAVTVAVTAPPQVVAGTAAPPSAAGALPAQRPQPTKARPASAPAPGARVRLARLRLDAPIVGVRLTGRVLQVPRDPEQIGWWRQGAVPGAGRGSAVLVGHVNYAGTTGAFAVLPQARPGDRIVLTRPELRFRVVAVRTYPKTSGIPSTAFAAGGPSQLVLITCGGAFDPSSGNYEDNVVVYAVPS